MSTLCCAPAERAHQPQTRLSPSPGAARRTRAAQNPMLLYRTLTHKLCADRSRHGFMSMPHAVLRSAGAGPAASGQAFSIPRGSAQNARGSQDAGRKPLGRRMSGSTFNFVGPALGASPLVPFSPLIPSPKILAAHRMRAAVRMRAESRWAGACPAAPSILSGQLSVHFSLLKPVPKSWQRTERTRQSERGQEAPWQAHVRQHLQFCRASSWCASDSS